MTVKANWKQWSIPFCLAASLASAPVLAQDLGPTVESDTTEVEALQEPAPLASGTVTDEILAGETSELAPVPTTEADSGSDPLEPLEPTVDDLRSESIGPEIKAKEVESTEVVEERYPNGQLKIAREVVQDEKGNYLNHGAWKMFTERGAVMMDGQFYEDARHGVWNRWYSAGEVEFLRQRPFNEYQSPFISQGIFDNGDLHGAWIVYDAKQRKVCEIRFNRGERDGLATWWHANGRKAREMKFVNGVVDGVVQEWAVDGSLVSKETFDEGRKLTTQTVHYGGNAKKFTGEFLEPPLAAKTLDDWTKGEMAVYSSTGKPIKHGKYTAWHPNGQTRMSGEYKYDSPVETFTWYYANGQKSLEGKYDNGKQEGEWNWWHENGQRSIKGFFSNGNPSDKWTWWNKEGKVAQSGDFSDEKGQIVVTPVAPTQQQAELPAKPDSPATR